jgi:chemotaxis protein CheX
MKVQYVNPFVCAAFSVIETLLGKQASKGELSMLPTIFTSQECNIITGVTGDIEGQVIYGMNILTADRIAAQMMGRQEMLFDELAASAIAELGNMITGNASALLLEAGYQCDITPPTMIRGAKIQMTTLHIPALLVPVIMDIGQMEITVSLKENLASKKHK